MVALLRLRTSSPEMLVTLAGVLRAVRPRREPAGSGVCRSGRSACWSAVSVIAVEGRANTLSAGSWVAAMLGRENATKGVRPARRELRARNWNRELRDMSFHLMQE